jgi:SAM-dependent methyltransferase
MKRERSERNLKLYDELAPWFHLLTAPEDYFEEAEFYRNAIISASDTPPITLLELGSGGGNNASHLKAHFQLTLVDLSPDMLRISQELNPECEHIQGDMRDIHLGRLFDAVFIHDAIIYMLNESDLLKAIKTAYEHCRSGGVTLFAPDHVKETFRPSTDHGGHDGEKGGIRYLDWTWDPDPKDAIYFSEMVYLIKDNLGNVQIEHDRHELGIFPRQTWLQLLTDAGFQAQIIPFKHSQIESDASDVFIGRKETR